MITNAGFGKYGEKLEAEEGWPADVPWNTFKGVGNSGPYNESRTKFICGMLRAAHLQFMLSHNNGFMMCQLELNRNLEISKLVNVNSSSRNSSCLCSLCLVQTVSVWRGKTSGRWRFGSGSGSQGRIWPSESCLWHKNQWQAWTGNHRKCQYQNYDTVAVLA